MGHTRFNQNGADFFNISKPWNGPKIRVIIIFHLSRTVDGQGAGILIERPIDIIIRSRPAASAGHRRRRRLDLHRQHPQHHHQSQNNRKQSLSHQHTPPRIKLYIIIISSCGRKSKGPVRFFREIHFQTLLDAVTEGSPVGAHIAPLQGSAFVQICPKTDSRRNFSTKTLRHVPPVPRI